MGSGAAVGRVARRGRMACTAPEGRADVTDRTVGVYVMTNDYSKLAVCHFRRLNDALPQNARQTRRMTRGTHKRPPLDRMGRI